MWFNHVVKVRDFDMINVNHLWKFVTRGAMIMCADSQVGIDIDIPVCNRGKKLSKTSITAIIFQIKNGIRFKATIDKTILDGMNPHRVGLFSSDDEPLPVVRMVFALASDTCAVVFPQSGQRHHLYEFTAFDIWCAGLSPDTFRDIGADLESYKVLLLRSMRQDDAFDVKEVRDDYRDQETVDLKGRLRRKMAPLLDKTEQHNFIHTRDNFASHDLGLANSGDNVHA